MASGAAGMPPALAKFRTAEAGRAGGGRDDPVSVMAGLRDARSEAACERAELAFVVDPAVKTATAPDVAPVLHFHSVGVDHTRRGPGRDQQRYGGNLAHDPSSGFPA